MYTYKIEQAIKAAALLHQDQLRKGAVAVPYVTHLVAVLMIIRDYTQEENTLVAALLHDTLEDTDYTAEELRADFGDTVAKIVLTLTEPERNKEVKIPWLEVKKTYAKQLKNGPLEAVIIAAADKAHNFRTTVEEYHDDHQRFIQDFGPHLDARLEAYQSIANVINNRLNGGIVHEFNHTWKEYKQFIYDVEKNFTKDQI